MKRIILALLALCFFCGSALAQNAGIRNENGTTHLGVEGDVGKLAVDKTGALITSTTAGGGAAVHAEDSAAASGDFCHPVMGIHSVAPASSAQAAQGDYVVPFVSAKHGMFVQNINETTTIDVALTVDTAAYAAGDYINDADDITDLSSAFINNVFSGEIRQVIVTDEGAEGANLEVWFFDTDPTSSTFTDNAAFTVADADLVNVCCVVPVTTHYAASASGVSIGRPTNCVCAGASTTLHAAIVAREAVTFDAADAVTLRVVIDQD